MSSVDLMNRIEERAGRILFVRTGEASLTLDGYVRPASAQPGTTPDGWAVTFEVSDARGKVLGRRELGVLVGDCSVATRAAELMFALTLDPDGVLGSGIPLEPRTQQLLDELLRGEPFDPDPSTLPSGGHLFGGAKPKPAPKARPVAEASPPTTASPVTEPATLDATGVAVLGALPRLAPGVALHVMIPTSIDWVIEIGVLMLGEQTVNAAYGDIGNATFGLQAGSLALCPLRLFTMLFLCAGAEYGRQSISASGFSSVREAPSRALFNVTVLGTLRVSLLSWLFLRAGAALLLPLVQHEYVYDSRQGDRQLFQVPPIAGRVELGLGMYL